MGRGTGVAGRGRGTNRLGCNLFENDNHWYRTCYLLNHTMRRSDTTPENHQKLDEKCEELLKTKPMSVQTSLREFQKTLPPRVEANMAELEFPNMVPANLAAVEHTEN